jgi:hypothetical protein
MPTEGSLVTTLGFGWVTRTRSGRGRPAACAGGGPDPQALLHDASVFGVAPKNAARFNPPARHACCALGLALADAGIRPPPRSKLRIGLIGTGARGCLDANAAYFSDYVAAGRTLGRGALFIYTLPSTPLAEGAIHFGLTGPLLHVAGEHHNVREALRVAASLIPCAPDGMAALCADETGAVCVLIGRPNVDTTGQKYPGAPLPDDEPQASAESLLDAMLRNPGGTSPCE